MILDSTRNKLRELQIIPVDGDEFVPIPSDELAALETLLGHPLPDGYQTFIREYGTSMFEREVFIDPIVQFPYQVGGETGQGSFSLFYGSAVPGDDDSLSLEWNLNMFRDRMPASIIPIGDDGGGHQICLGISGEERGKVYLWDHHNEWDEADYTDIGEPIPDRLEFQNVHLIAESFRDFIENRLCIDDSQ